MRVALPIGGPGHRSNHVNPREGIATFGRRTYAIGLASVQTT